jgi:hypothetical protein
MDEKDRLAVAPVDESQIEPVMMEELHGVRLEVPSTPQGRRAERPAIYS